MSIAQRDEPTSAAKSKEELWSVICCLNDFTLPQITSSEGLKLTTMRRFITSFVKAGALKESFVRKGSNQKRYHVIAKNRNMLNVDLTGIPKAPTGQQRMWMGMKAAKHFDFHDVAIFAGVPEAQARHYCYMLRQAGYLFLVRPSTSNRVSDLLTFNPGMNTGLHAPRISHDKTEVYDRNTHKVVWKKEGKL